MLVRDIKSDLIRGWALKNCGGPGSLEDELVKAFIWSETLQSTWFWCDVASGCEETELRSKYPHLFTQHKDMSFLGSSQNSSEGTEMLEAATYKQDLKEFTKAAMQGLLANPDLTHTPAIDLGYKAVVYAEAALAELKRQNKQPVERNKP